MDIGSDICLMPAAAAEPGEHEYESAAQPWPRRQRMPVDRPGKAIHREEASAAVAAAVNARLEKSKEKNS